uniref:Uncharacterized protein n=1 Tax=Oryza meridionalis TaxID=40149 RepID=A0A0E0F0W0_9ORYZ
MRCTPFPQNRDTKSVCIITCIKNMLFLIYGTRLKISDLMDSPKQALHVVNLEQQCQATRIRVWRKAYHLVSLPAWWALHVVNLEQQC